MYSDSILATYRSQFDTLSRAKQFHFVSRLRWTHDDAWTHDQLALLKNWFLGSGDSRFRKLGMARPDPIHLNASAERMPFFNKHPWLFGYELQLFQLLHAKAQYDTDLTKQLRLLQPIETKRIEELTQDPKTLAALSTYLVDVYYLHHRLIDKDEVSLISLDDLRAALRVDLPITYKARLNIYLLTHCIIGETLFYARAIPATKAAFYQQIATELEKYSLTYWSNLTIDIKLEVALALQLASVDSSLINRAIDGAEHAFDNTLGYIVDHKMPHKNDLEWAEHRNVLYLMVTKDPEHDAS